MKRTSPYGQQGRSVRRKTSRRNLQGKPRYFAPSPEKKFHDFDSSAVLNTASTIQLVNPSCNIIAQGNDESERVGRKITVTKIQIRGYVKIPGQTAISDASNRVRIIVYHDRQANKNSTAVTGSTLLESDTLDSFRNLSNGKRFKFLCDKTILLNQLSGGGNGTSDRLAEVQRGFQIYKNVNIPINYDSTTGAITELTENNIGVAVVCSDFTTTAPQIIYKGRLRYTDL
jgi:hypothetical protein